MLRFGAAGTFAALSALALASLAACVNPKNDYEDYIARTKDAETTLPTDDASFDGVSGDAAGFTQSYVMACISQSTGESITLPTLFIATASFVASDSNGDGTINFTDTALVVGATDTSDLAGGAPTPVSATVTASQADLNFGNTTIPAAADPLGQGPIVFSTNNLHVYIGPGTNLCGIITGHTTSPEITDLTSGNICIFFPFEGSVGQVPTLTQAEFHCP
jgi:hypothetical protein